MRQISLASSRFPTIALTAFILLAGRSGPIRAASYTLTDLGVVAPFTSSTAAAVNTSGQVVGELSSIGGIRPFLSGPEGGMVQDLGTLGGAQGWATGVNASGQVVGSSSNANLETHAFLWGANGGTLQDLGTLGGTNSYGNGINDSGQVVGASTTAVDPDGMQHAFFYSNGTMRDLGTLGGTNSYGNGINASGQVTGYSSNGQNIHAFLSGPNGGALKDLGTLGGSESFGDAVNASGQVVGQSNVPGGTPTTFHAFISAPNGGGLTDIGSLGGPLSRALAINDSGQVVGSSDILNPTLPIASHAFLYSGGTLLDLNSLLPAGSGITLVEADGINNAGQIVADGFVSGDVTYLHTFLLTPAVSVPEPSSLTLMGLGVMAALGLARRAGRRGKSAGALD